MIIAHMAYLLYVLVAIIATVLTPYFSDTFASGDLYAKHFSAKMFIVLLGRLTIASLFIVFISFFHFVIFSHKFCGPLVNIGHTIARISEKDFTRKIYLRKGDFLKNEAKQINDMMRSLANSIAAIKKENRMLLEEIEKSLQSPGKQTAIEAKLEDFRKRANQCRVQLENFQLDADATDDVGPCQCRQVVSDSPLSANTCS